MQHSVKGLTFSEDELAVIQLSDLQSDRICAGHLFAFIKGRPYLLLRAGDFIESEFLEKYRSRGVKTLRCLPVAYDEDALFWKNLFAKFKTLRSEQEHLQLRDEFIKAFADAFWRQSDKSFLGFARGCFESFYQLPIEVVRGLNDTSSILYSRALVVASIAVATCVMSSLTDYRFLKDMFNAGLLLDYGFVGDENFNYRLVQACERERNAPGSAMRWLAGGPKGERDRRTFLEHPAKGAEKAMEQVKYFSHPEIIDHIRYHHELADGSGFPSGFVRSSLAASETILIFADQMTPFQEGFFQRGDGELATKQSFLGLRERFKAGLLPISAPLAAWDSAMRWIENETRAAAQGAA